MCVARFLFYGDCLIADWHAELLRLHERRHQQEVRRRRGGLNFRKVRFWRETSIQTRLVAQEAAFSVAGGDYVEPFAHVSFVHASYVFLTNERLAIMTQVRPRRVSGTRRVSVIQRNWAGSRRQVAGRGAVEDCAHGQHSVRCCVYR